MRYTPILAAVFLCSGIKMDYFSILRKKSNKTCGKVCLPHYVLSFNSGIFGRIKKEWRQWIRAWHLVSHSIT